MAENHEAPLVIGHPKDNSPAFGWVKGLSAQKEGKQTSLYAEIEPTPNFAEALENKHYKKVSAAFYTPDDETNPTPGVWALRHVGALGAMPPAVKGLQAFEFNDGGEFVEFLEWGNPFKPLIEMLQNLREFLIQSEDMETANQVVPQWKIDSVEEAADPNKKSNFTDFSEKKTPTEEPQDKDKNMASEKDLEDLKKQHAEVIKENEKLKKEKAEFAEASAKNAAKAVVDKAISEGKVTPAQATGLVEFMTSLPCGNENIITFSEGDAEIKKQSPFEFMEGLLERLPKQIEFTEITAAKAKAEYSETEIVAKANIYRSEQKQAGIDVSFTEAVTHVMEGE